MAVRIALGAQRKDVLMLILGQGSVLILAGTAIGLAVSLVVARFISSLLFGVSPGDPLTLAGVAAALALVALLACYVPARRATRVDPMVALRCE